MHPTAFRHLKAGTITAKELRYFKYACRVKYHGLIAAATVSG